MARPRTRNLTTGTGSDAPSNNEPRTQTRRKRVAAPQPDTLQETMTLINAALESRGAQGATPELLNKVVSWARSIREEGDEIRIASNRIRRTKGLLTPERVVKYETNRALLEGVLSGRIKLQLEDNGALAFVHESVRATPVVEEVETESAD